MSGGPGALTNPPSGGSLAFSNPSSGKIDQQRKILEEFERQKKKGYAGPAGPAGLVGPLSPPAHLTSSPVSGDPQLLGDVPAAWSPAQKAAMELAAKTSSSFFIPQDSAFGNTILPVIPRLSPK